jgi:hypothetical protein
MLEQGAPMTQNECTSNIKYPGSSVYHPPDTSPAITLDGLDADAVAEVSINAEVAVEIIANCSTPYIVYGIGLSTGGQQQPGVRSVEACCAACSAAGDACGAWTFHNKSGTFSVSNDVRH